MIEKHQQANGIGRGKITINPEYIKRAGEITVGGQPIKVLSSNPNTGRVLAQFPDGHIEEVKAAPDYFIGGNTSTKELKNNQPVYGETNTAANERADSQDEAHDLTPIFSNLITAGQISTMNEGAQDLQNGKYLEGTTKLFSPAMFGSGIGGVAARSVIGGYNLFNKNGVRKTYNLFNQGHYGEGALSLLGDAFNVAMATEGLGSISNALKGTSGYRNWRLSNAINKGVKENAVITAYNRNPAVKDIGNLWDYQSYLDNVFPNSKVKDVLWHGSRSKNLETFDTNMIGSNMPIKNSVGMYLAPERNTAVGYGTRGGVYPVLLNTETPFITNQFFGGISKNGVNVTKISPKVRSTLLANSDAVIAPKRGEIAFFNPDNALILGSGADVTGFRRFMSKPQITAKNAASVTPAQWTALQDAAIARGDMAEAQRLRDLHGKIHGYNIRGSHASKVSDDFTEFNTDLKIKGTNKAPTIYNDSRDVTAGAFFGDNSNGVINQFGKPRDFLLKIDNPLQVDAYGMRYNRLLPPGTTKEDIIKEANNLRIKGYTEDQIDSWIEGQFTSDADKYALKVYNDNVHDGAIIKNVYEGHMNPAYMEDAIPTTDYIITKPSQAKSADAVTYDNNGVRIPLGDRDNFNINDIRYGLLPFGIGLTGYGLYKKKQGGKMNTLEFLKNGSGIYIKPKNRGKFTKYCHGKVTSECIARGKRSSDPTVRKRATFAQNVRRWKHEEGGKAFINGVNVLDSNPTAYKYVKKKYKMAQEGTKLTFGQKVSNIGKNVGNWINNNQGIVNTAVNGITGFISANKKSKAADQFAKAKEAEMKSFKDKTWKEKYMENLQAQEDRSDVVNMSRAYNQTYGDVAQAVQEKQQKIDSQIAAAQQKAAQAQEDTQAQEAAQGDAWGGILKGAGEIAMNALASNGIPKSKTSPTSLTGQKTSSFGGISTPQLTSPQTNYSFLK